jgi:hypothetical protein
MARTDRVEVHFSDGKVERTADIKTARQLARSKPTGMPVEIWQVWVNDAGVGRLVDRIEPARRAS